MKTHIETFIFAHDQRIILDMEQNQKFADIPNLRYVLVGDCENKEVAGNPRVIIEAEHNPNYIYKNRNLLSFTGWLLLFNHGLIGPMTTHVNLFEYDIKLSGNIISEIERCIAETDPDVIGYIQIPAKTPMYADEPRFCKEIVESINKNHGWNVMDVVNQYKQFNGDVSVTSNHTLSVGAFNKFMNFMKPCVADIEDNKYGGHQTERALSFYYLGESDVSVVVLPNCLFHYQLDTHQTQNIPVEKYLNNYDAVVKK